jgi:cephalosporin-C deacetylase-like acetyl esterase
MRIRDLASTAVFLFSPMLLSQAPSPSLVQPLPDVANSDSNAGRAQLNKYLDDIASRELADRSIAISAIQTRAQAEARQREVHKKILALIGDLPQKTALNPKSLGTTQANGFRIEKILYYSQPNFPVTALLYLPDSKPGAPPTKFPAIVIAPGHGITGKTTDYAFASTFARNGFAVLSYDPIGQGERLQYPDPANPGHTLLTQSTGEHGEAGLQPTLIGDALARTFAWDGIRAVDYLTTRPEIDPNRIGAFGCSGGGVMTALLGALDSRIQAIGTACYLTSFDTLLPSLGPQDSEQSTPNFIASGLDFADWVELAAPRPYAIISTAQDMFPYAGALATATESRRFYSLFDPASAGTPTGSPTPGTPTGPTLNPDTSNSILATANLQFITGIGRHGNLRPLTAEIVSFFLVHLAHTNTPPILPSPPPPGTSPFALPSDIPPSAFQVTPTGQVATSYPGSETVHTLTLNRAHQLDARVRIKRHLTVSETQQAVREITHATAIPGKFGAPGDTDRVELKQGDVNPTYTRSWLFLHADEPPLVAHPVGVPVFPDNRGIHNRAVITFPNTPGRHPAVLLLAGTVPPSSSATPDDLAAYRRQTELTEGGNVVLLLAPRPSPPGNEETKSPILGTFYLTELRAELVGKTLLGLRIDDVIRALNYLSSRPDVAPGNITAQASGHLGLVLLHAAVLEMGTHSQLKLVTIDHSLASYSSLLEAPMPVGASEDILPGVYLRYDTSDLLKALGPRVIVTAPTPGSANPGQPSP